MNSCFSTIQASISLIKKNNLAGRKRLRLSIDSSWDLVKLEELFKVFINGVQGSLNQLRDQIEANLYFNIFSQAQFRQIQIQQAKSQTEHQNKSSGNRRVSPHLQNTSGAVPIYTLQLIWGRFNSQFLYSQVFQWRCF